MSRPVVPPYEAFAARARALTREIPAEYLEGVEDVVVHREAKRHPLIDDVMTLGEQEPSAMVAMTGSELVRSIIHLYYGSFVELARRDRKFDVDAELRETIEHEVQHHLEDRAGVRTLVDEDDLFDAHQRFRAGLETPPGWWRRGEELEDGVWQVDLDLFVELRLRRRELEALRGTTVALTVLDEPLDVDVPADAKAGDILTFEGTGVADEGDDPPGPEAHDEEDGDAGDLHVVLDVRR
ncbi:MAG: metallopeptidase family protein [Planctomycetia bacterium]|nr:metallopeptidase family protein [Planctomycetia bacterium]